MQVRGFLYAYERCDPALQNNPCIARDECFTLPACFQGVRLLEIEAGLMSTALTVSYFVVLCTLDHIHNFFPQCDQSH